MATVVMIVDESHYTFSSNLTRPSSRALETKFTWPSRPSSSEVKRLRLPGLQGVILELSALEDELFEVPNDESFLVVVVGRREVSAGVAAVLGSNDD